VKESLNGRVAQNPIVSHSCIEMAVTSFGGNER